MFKIKIAIPKFQLITRYYFQNGKLLLFSGKQKVNLGNTGFEPVTFCL